MTELVLAGKATGAARPVARAHRASLPLAAQVRHLGYVDAADRRALYEGASVLVLPSLDEGFGLPVLEAMTLGVPVVASRRGSLPEVVGDAGQLVDADDPQALADAIDARPARPRRSPSACASQGHRALAAVPLGPRGAADARHSIERAIAHDDAHRHRRARDSPARRPASGRYLAGLLPSGRRPARRAAPVRAVCATRRLPPRLQAVRRRASLPGTSGTWWQQVTLPAAARRDDARCVLRAAVHRAALLERADGRRHLRRVVRGASRVVSDARRPASANAGALVGAHRARASSRSRSSRGARSASTSACDDSAHSRHPAGHPRAGLARTARDERRGCSSSARSSIAGTFPISSARSRLSRDHPDASLDIVGDNRSYPFEDIAAAIDREQLGDRMSLASVCERRPARRSLQPRARVRVSVGVRRTRA